jgi:hypothetical protein
MNFISAALLCALLPHQAYPFAPTSQQNNLLSRLSLRQSNPLEKQWNNNNEGLSTTSWSDFGCSTRLHMAFDTEKPTNIFDGPMALTKERDACGVGFIANTKSGG